MIDDVYQAALAAMRHHLDEAGADYSLDDGEILLGDHRLGLSITFEGFVAQGEHTLAPLDIQIHLDGDTGDRFRVGTLGIGRDRTAAIREGIAEWHLLAVAPLLAALGAPVEKRRAAAQPQRVAGWDLFAGRAGIRGPVPQELLAGSQFYGAMVQCLRDVAATWEPPTRFQLRSICFMATCGEGGAQIEAAIDGLVNEPLTQSMAKLPWPSAGDVYLYKQLFVLRREPAA
jgi:hypothetical protein